jgi:purine-binding chemotaxis protein CheW
MEERMKDTDLLEDDILFEEMEDELTNQYLTFILGDETYGIKVEMIKEVNEYSKILNIPKVPGYIRGIMNLRGEIIPVIDLSYRFYNRKSEITNFTCVIVVELLDGDKTVFIGVIIDAVESVIDIPKENIEEAPEFGLTIRSDFAKGIGKEKDKFVILLNIDKVLNLDELSSFNYEKF